MQNDNNGTLIGIINLIVGIATVLVGSYFTFVIGSIRREMSACKENCTGRMNKVENELVDLSKTIYIIKGQLE